MKKLVLFAMAALALVACDKNKGGTTGGGSAASVQLTLAENGQSISLKVGENKQLTAVVVPSNTVLTWESSNTAYATVSNTGLVTAVAEGNVIISVKAGDVKQSCIVSVTNAGGGGSGTKPQLKGSKIWPIIMDGVTSESAAAKIVFDFRPDDVHKFLYVWEQTYTGGAASGKNFYQTSNEGDYTSLEVTALGWSGLGFCMNPSLSTAGYEKDTALTGAIQRLAEAIVANPSDYYLHMAIKGTDAASHCFYVFGNEGTKFGIGTSLVYSAPKLIGNYTRDGSWTELDIPMSDYSVVMSEVTKDKKYEGMNLFVALTEGVQGYKLNLDAVYFYKK